MPNQSLMHYTLTHMKLRTIVHELQPVSVVVARDVEMLSVVTRLLNRSGTNRDEAAKDERTAWRRYYYQIGACSPQVSLGLRFHTCLSLIERAERERADLPYTWVIRTRPDVAIPWCAPPAAPLAGL